ncbi:hypothetical protein SUGI_0918850 [Cryptomeria japonica]|nr:hypothetical protein SUGI_0918850 [Cryptomeria japonica]
MTEIEAIHAVASSQGFSKGMIIGEDESHKMEKETFLHGISSDDRVTRQSSNDEQQENSKQKRMPSYQRLTHSRSLKTGNSLLATKSSIQSGKDRVLAFTNKGSRAEVENVEVTSATSKRLHLARNKLAVKQLRSIIGVLATSNVTTDFPCRWKKAVDCKIC